MAFQGDVALRSGRPGRRWITTLATALLVSTSVLTSPAVAAPGDLDSRFNGGTATFALHQGGTEGALSVALQPDGKAVIGGVTRTAEGTRRVALARYGTDGLLDPTFGNGGLVEEPGPGDGSFVAFLGAYDVAVGPHGRIAVAAPLSGMPAEGSWRSWNVAVFAPDGSRDATFGGDGWVTTPFQPGCDAAAGGVAFDAQGRVLVAGIGGCYNRFIVARYLRDGTLDPGFGSGGIVDVGAGGALSVTFDPEGRILVGGALGATPEVYDTGLVRLDPRDGSLDSSFGEDGVVRSDFGSDDIIERVAAHPWDGTILVSSRGQNNAIQLARYTPGGSLDTTFSDDGTTVVEKIGPFGRTSLGLQPDGRILVAGWARSAAGVPAEDFGLVRLLPDGTTDATWGTGGLVTTDFDGGFDAAIDLAVRPNGDVIVVGEAQVGGIDVSGVAAYRGDLAASLCPGLSVENADIVIGTSGDDTITGSTRNDLILGLGGNDTVSGTGGHDCVWGGPGHDVLDGGKGRDRLHGEGGDDKVDGGPDDDVLAGGAGTDAVKGGPGDDVVTIASGEVGAGSLETIAGGPSSAGDRLELGAGIGPADVHGGPPRFSVVDPSTAGTYVITAVELVIGPT